MEKNAIFQRSSSREILLSSLDKYNGKDHSNRILYSKLLKVKEQMKGQDEKKESVLGSIKKYQMEDKQKPKQSKEKPKETER
ncbi:hypothetical protein [Streptobacillus notomytis]|uniref:hypothetical protein n=1 Tax=Streptobacillus notomytis TaxID=1712031 RepID=UPI001FCFE4FC